MTTLEKVLIPTDLSAESNSILPYAVTLAQAFDSKTYLLHVMDPDSLKEPERLEDFPRLSRFLALDLAAPDLPPLAPRLSVERIYRYSKEPTAVILDFIRRKRINLVCMASTANGHKLGWWSAGAAIERVIKQSPCSVLCMRGRPVRDKEWKRPRFKHILLLTELSAHGAAPLLRILPWAQKFNSMLHVLPLLKGRPVQSAEELPAPAVSQLQASHTNVLLFAEPARRMRNLVHFVTKTPMDLIVMPPRARAEFSTPLINDVLVKLMQVTESPILLLR